MLETRQVANEVKDRDRDGLADPDDKCPGDAEDKDNFQDDDGCPEIDNDQDGVLDTHDKCPIAPEDKDAFHDEDGCADPDNDQDGIADAKDQCIDKPEDKNGFQDDDGCPDDREKQRKVDEDRQKAEQDKRKTEAASHFKQGKAFHDAGAYDEAIVEYEAANALVPAAGLLYNLGQVYRLRDKKGDAEKALDYYKRYVVAEPKGAAADDARNWIAKLTIRLKKK